MKNSDSLTWLYNLFNTSNFDPQQNIDYLQSYPQTGIHFYLSRIIDFDEKYTLHLVHIMFYHCEDEISYPIMDILVKKSLYNKSFGLKLFFTLKSYRKYLNKEQIGFYRLIIQRIMECDKFRRDRSRKNIVIDQKPFLDQKLSTREISTIKYKKLENQFADLKLLKEKPPSKVSKDKLPPSELSKEKSPSKVSKDKLPPSELSKEKSSSKVLEEKSPSEVLEEKLPPSEVSKDKKPSKVSKEKTPSKVSKDKTPSKVSKDKSPSSEVLEDKSPSEVPKDKTPSKVPKDKKPSKVSKEKTPSKVSKEKSPSEVLEEKLPSEVLKEKFPSKMSEEKLPSEVLKEKTPSEVSEEKLPSEVSKEKTPSEVSKDKTPSKVSEEKSEKVKNEKKQTNQGTLKKVQENSKKLRTKRYMVKTRPILNLNRGTGDLSSIFLFFCSATSFFFPNKILSELVSYEKMFYTFKAHSIIFPRRLDTTFKGCVNFLDDLVMISFRLKNLPIKIRQRALEIELQYMNQILPAKISLPFSDGMNIVNINIPFSRTLNSVENVPYILVYECSNKIKTVKKDFYNEIYLLRQLYALLKTGNENLTIIDKIIDQLVMDDSGSQNNSDDENLNTDILETGRSLSENSLNLDQNTHHTPSCTPSLQDGFVYKEEIVKKKNKQSWTETVQEIKEHSHFKDQKPEVKCIIIKTGNELGPEVIASEVISEMKAIFEEENLRIWIKPYRIYPVYHNAGFVEVVLNAKSIHEIKKAHNTIATGKTFLKRYYCEKYQDNIDKAKQNFLESLVGYSLVSYFLGLKDRHNGNILIDDEGHLVHVDFGFVLGLHPGIFCVETAPFKMSAEYIHLLGNRLDEFKKLFIQGFLAIRTNHKKLLRIMEICMGNPKYRFLDINSIDAFKKRLQPDLNNRELEDFIISLIDWSIKSTTTGLYDSYQYFSNGYMK